MTVPTIPVIPAKMGEAGAHQEQLYAILSAIKANVEAGTASSLEIQALQTAVGDETEGLVKDVADLQTAVGDETAGLLADVDALETTVGDETAGLVKDVADLKTAVGDETAGIVKDVDDLQAKVAANQADSTATSVAGLVADFNTLLASLKAAGLMVEDTQG
jgi:hypothetical protein